jgi:glycosyltransferase involved in cell wall biosynthesis
LSKGFSPDRIIKNNYGFAVSTNSPAHNGSSKNGVFTLLYVGQLHYRKGLRYALEAFNKLKHPKKKFVIVGPKTPITGLEKTKIPEGVVFTGTLKGEELKEQYRRASAFVLPSIDEGLALVQYEALSFGLPLLITTNTGGSDLIKNGVEGFIVPPADSNILADKLQQMADDRFLLESMSMASLKTTQSVGDWDNAVERLVTKLKSILDAKNKKS